MNELGLLGSYSRPRLPLILDKAFRTFHANAFTPAGCLIFSIKTVRHGITKQFSESAHPEKTECVACEEVIHT